MLPSRKSAPSGLHRVRRSRLRRRCERDGEAITQISGGGQGRSGIAVTTPRFSYLNLFFSFLDFDSRGKIRSASGLIGHSQSCTRFSGQALRATINTGNLGCIVIGNYHLLVTTLDGNLLRGCIDFGELTRGGLLLSTSRRGLSAWCAAASWGLPRRGTLQRGCSQADGNQQRYGDCREYLWTLHH